jgi:hypothetical protein
MLTLTQAQEDVLEQVKELLSEHFDCWSLAYEVDLDEVDQDGEQCTFWAGSFDGGRNRAKGLVLSHLDNLREIKVDARTSRDQKRGCSRTQSPLPFDPWPVTPRGLGRAIC